MKKLRIFICALVGHRSLVIQRDVAKSGERKYIRFVAECERCGTVREGNREHKFK